MVSYERNYAEIVKINAPEFYQDAEFVAWLNNEENRIATWHKQGEATNDFSDIFMTWDGGEGSDSDMPEHIWDQICNICTDLVGATGFCFVWLQNLKE